MKTKIKWVSVRELLFLGLLVLYPFRHMFMGVDLMDSGYNCANFTYSGTEYMDSMWFFATWSANMFGSFLTKLPWGGTLAGMNFYTILPVSGMVIICYFFATRKMHIPSWIVFFGEMLAISLCWLPTTVLYTYLTYFLSGVAVILLYQGLTEEKNLYLVLAGVCLGLNISVRFSNLPQAALIVAVWYYCLIGRKSFKELLRITGLCIAGYLGAIIVFAAIIAVVYGMDEYIAGIGRLFAMTEYATDYSSQSMLKGMIGGYLEISYFLKRCILAGGCSFLVCLMFPGRFKHFKQIVTVFCMLVLLWWFQKSGFYSLDTASYYSIYQPCILLLLMAMGLSAFVMIDKETEPSVKLRSLLIICLILLTSLGSNNAIFSSINNLFFVMPVFLGLTYDFLKSKEHILFFPFKAILIAVILLVTVQTAGFGWRYVYEEADGARDLSAKITEIPVLKGIRTGKEKVAFLEEMYMTIKDNGWQQKECILFGDIPGIAYCMELAPAMNIWSDLRSYSPETMYGDLDKIKKEMETGGAAPLLIIHQKYEDYFKQGNADSLPQEITVKIKLDYLKEFAREYGYKEVYSNEKILVFSTE